MNKIIAFSGSIRTDSYNKKMLKAAVLGARDAGAEVTVIDLRDFPLPLYDGDLEIHEGIPENGKKLKELFKEQHAFLLALPEYNSSMSGVFKNTIDWISRPTNDEGELECFIGKVAGLMSTSTGKLGGLRGLIHVRAMLENIHVLVMTEQISIPFADKAFDEYGNFKDEMAKKSVEKLGADLVDLTLRVRGFHPHK